MFGFRNKIKERIDGLKTIHLEVPNSGKIDLTDEHGRYIDCDTAKLLFAYEYITNEFYDFSCLSSRVDFIIKLRRDFYLTKKGLYVKIVRNCENGKVIMCHEVTEKIVKTNYFKMCDSEYQKLNFCGERFDILIDNFHAEKEEI